MVHFINNPFPPPRNDLPCRTHQPRSPYLTRPSSPWPSSRCNSTSSSLLINVLSPGDFIGEGCLLQGEPIRLSVGLCPPHDNEPAKEFQVVRPLGNGSYAVVYLVRQVLSRPSLSDDGHLLGPMDLDGQAHHPSIQYGREYAVKCLSKSNLDEEALAAQLSEATIHQSLRSHPNIVTLHRTFETSAFLFLLLEFVPGEDLFYFLEQARDHCEADCPDSCLSSSHTPPTPSLLSALHPAQILSRTRLRLISSMFVQMCEAVAACHDQQVFHRDIKPENFIVTDGWTTSPDGHHERRVIVKLSDFGLSTRDIESSDMDCGSAPYMSYECRNNIAPTYRPRAADVWSLGIVLINMLYHYNPWNDTAQDACPSFNLFRQQPVQFLMQRFSGMTRPVADFLANKVFCFLDDPADDSARIGAREFGAWARDLPALLANDAALTIQRPPPSALSPTSHRPSSRPASRCGTPITRTPALAPRSLPSAPTPSLAPIASELATVIDQEEQDPDAPDPDRRGGQEVETESVNSRSTSHTRKRKRGARKGKGSISTCASAGGAASTPSSPLPVLPTPASPEDKLLSDLALASQSLAREISRASKASSMRTTASAASSTRSHTRREQPPPSPPPVPKKPSIWKLSLRKSSAPSGSEEPGSPNSPGAASSVQDVGHKVAHVSSLIMGLNASVPIRPPGEARGRRPGASPPNSPMASTHRVPRNLSPISTRSGGWPTVSSSASSTTSSNWRSGMSSAGRSAFTRHGNVSGGSVSTVATSVSSGSGSWRAQSKAPQVQQAPPPAPSVSVTSLGVSTPSDSRPPLMPKNVKYLEGVPWQLDELPRGMHPNPTGDIFGSPPMRKRVRKADQTLEAIDETQRSPSLQLCRDAATSTTDLAEEECESPKKVPKGQINALAKMLSALRR